jgi:hypothetical protein
MMVVVRERRQLAPVRDSSNERATAMNNVSDETSLTNDVVCHNRLFVRCQPTADRSLKREEHGPVVHSFVRAQTSDDSHKTKHRSHNNNRQMRHDSLSFADQTME